MQYIKGLENYHNERPTAITIGKFDGLHLGHELLIEKIISHQQSNDVDSVVLAFDTSFFWKNKQILSSEERKERLNHRVDYLVECPLDETISHMEAQTFIEEILVKKFHAKYIVVGEDFSFGYQRKGNWELLKALEAECGYQVDVIKKICYNAREISSTYIREAIDAKDYDLASKLLGYEIKNI